MTRDERGMVGGMEGLVLGILIFVIGTLVVVNAWAVVDTKLAVSAAAREAVRAYVEAPSAADASTRAAEAAHATLSGYGRGAKNMQLDMTRASFQRCALATIEVRYDVPLIGLPVVGRAGGKITTVGRHSEIVDPYRSGLPTDVNGGDPCG